MSATVWSGLEAMLGTLTRIEKAWNSPGALKRQLGRILVAQTQKRITDEKAAPDGTPWEPWSPEYAKTRTGANSLLRDSDALLNSIRASVTKAGVSVDSDVPYAARQNTTRPFFGLSDENAEEIANFVNGWMAKI